MIDQDKMRALAVELRKYTGTGCVVDDAHAAADAIDLLLAEVEAAAADKRDAWRMMDDAPLDGTWVMLFARYSEANASVPIFGFHREGKWWESTRLGISELIPTYWMPRPVFPAALAQRQGEGS